MRKEDGCTGIILKEDILVVSVLLLHKIAGIRVSSFDVSVLEAFWSLYSGIIQEVEGQSIFR